MCRTVLLKGDDMTLMLRGLVFIAVFSAVCLVLGDLFLRILGWRRGFGVSYVWGLTAVFALFHLVAYPLYRLGTSFALLFWLFLAILSTVLLVSVFTGIRKELFAIPYSEEIKTFLRNLKSKKTLFLVLVLAGAVFIHFFMSEGFYYSSSDDGLYITKGMEAIEQNSLAINDDMAWYGRGNAPVTNYENGSTYSFFLAFLAYAFGLPASALTKTFFLFNLLIAHLAAVLWAFSSVLESKDPSRGEGSPLNLFPKKVFFLIAYIGFQLFCVKEGSSGMWMTGFLYEGKSILIGVMFPLLLGSCFTLLRKIEIISFREWLSIVVVLLASAEVSVIGIIFPLILYFSFGAAILVGTKFRYLREIWLPAVLAALPLVVFALLSYFSASDAFFDLGGISTNDWVSAGRVASESVASENRNGTSALKDGTVIPNSDNMDDADQKKSTEKAGSTLQERWIMLRGSLKAQLISWKDHFLYTLDFWQFFLYLLSLIIVMVIGTKDQKILFVLSPIVLLLTFANPFLSDFVAEKITTPIVYWRIFWLFPVYFLPAAVLTELFEKLTGGEFQRGVTISLLVLGILGGFEMFRYSVTGLDYSVYPFAKNVGKLINVRPELRHNTYGLNAATVEIADAVLEDWDEEEDPWLLFCFNRPFEIRQYSTKIVMAAPVRNYDSAWWNINGTETRLGWFIQNYSSIEDGELLRGLLERINVDYVLFDGRSAVKDLEKYGFKRVGTGSIELWRMN